MRARIAEKHEVAKGTLLVLFDLLGEEVDFTPGQYFFVTLLDPPYDDERGPRRHFSVVTSPNERALGFCTRLRDSAFKRSLLELPIGAEAEVEEPKGSFPPPRRHESRLCLPRRRDRHHRLSQHAPLHRRRRPATSRDADLLEPRPRLHPVSRRALAARR